MGDAVRIAAREQVAARYPRYVGTMPDGKPLEGVCYRAILSGAWDSGALVRDAEAVLREAAEGGQDGG